MPLIFRYGMPYVMASWGGRKVEFLVDTGTGPVIWPQWLRLKGRPLHLSGRIGHLAGRPTRADWVIAPDISLGGFTIRDLATIATDAPRPDPSAPQIAAPPILGLQAFNGVIMTIDYSHKRLILRDRDFFMNISRRPQRSHAQLVNFPAYDNSLVTVPGTLAGHKAQFLLDTGCYYPGVINDSYAHKYLHVVPIWTSPRNGVAGAGKTWYGVRNLNGSIIGKRFTVEWMLTLESASGGAGTSADALLGSPWFMVHRVTIDQYRNMVLIQPK